MKRRLLVQAGAATAASLASLWPVASRAQSRPVFIGLDAEFGLKGSTSAQAIQLGIDIALDEINTAGGVLGGRPLQLVTRDNKSLPAHAVNNLKELAAVPDLVAVVGGRFSSAVLDTVPLLHELKMPLLAAWSSADAIIEHTHRPSYTFRLSLRDSWAMPMIAERARQHGYASLGLLAWNSSWGRGNEAVLKAHLSQPNSPQQLADVRWFNRSDAAEVMLGFHQSLRRNGAKAIILVANDQEASALVTAMAAMPAAERLPIKAHWGITGGDFAEQCGPGLTQIDLEVIQTYSFIGAKRPRSKAVIDAAKRRSGVAHEREILSPVGLAHAYDLTHILARAVNLAGRAERSAVRDTLERVRNYKGLIRDYAAPFTAERHEALTAAELMMARFQADGSLVRRS